MQGFPTAKCFIHVIVLKVTIILLTLQYLSGGLQLIVHLVAVTVCCTGTKPDARTANATASPGGAEFQLLRSKFRGDNEGKAIT